MKTSWRHINASWLAGNPSATAELHDGYGIVVALVNNSPVEEAVVGTFKLLRRVQIVEVARAGDRRCPSIGAT